MCTDRILIDRDTLAIFEVLASYSVVSGDIVPGAQSSHGSLLFAQDLMLYQ
jgi:hypothetical protein